MMCLYVVYRFGKLFHSSKYSSKNNTLQKDLFSLAGTPNESSEIVVAYSAKQKDADSKWSQRIVIVNQVEVNISEVNYIFERNFSLAYHLFSISHLESLLD